VAAPAAGDRVRVVDREPRLLDRVDVVDLCALQVRRAERIDDDRDAVRFELDVALDSGAVEAEAVLEPGAAAALIATLSTLTSASSAISCLILSAAAAVTDSSGVTSIRS
jgi:hypothetical protein